MFGTIRKHQTWLWAVIIAVIIVSFVLFFSPYSRMNNSARGEVDYGTINGEKVTQEQYSDASREVLLSYFFKNGSFPTDQTVRSGAFDPQRETYQWMLLLNGADKMGIRVGPQETARVAQAMIFQFQKSGIKTADDFIRQVLVPNHFEVEDLERYVRHFLIIQELIGTVGLSGKLVTPAEAQGLYEREHQELSTEAVFFSLSNHLSAVTATPEALNQFYTNHQAFYRVPDRVQVKYVRVDLSNFLAQAEADLMKTNFNDMLDLDLQKLGTNYTRFGKTPAEARAKIRELRIKEVAMPRARQAGAEFAGPLFDKEPIQAGNLEILAKEKGMPVGTTAPFDSTVGPRELDVWMDFVQRAFSLTPSDPFAGPIIGTNAVYVIALDKKIPSYVPTLDQIHDKVAEDFKIFTALNQARMEGAAFAVTLTNELAMGKPFSSICLNAKLKPVPLPAFSLSSEDLPEVEGRVTLNQLKQMAFSTPPGKASGFQTTPEGGIILYVKSKLPLDVARMSSELPAYVNRVRSARQNDAFNDWFRKEYERLMRDNPALQPKQQPSLAPGPAQSRT
jgi:hypothetical protein